MLANAPVCPTLPVVDKDRARKFYTETLGLTFKKEFPNGEMMFSCGDGTALMIYPRPTPTKADNTAASFMVQNVEQMVADLRAKGVTFEEYDFPGLKTVNGIATLNGVKGAWFKDPDGNILAIGEM